MWNIREVEQDRAGFFPVCQVVQFLLAYSTFAKLNTSDNIVQNISHLPNTVWLLFLWLVGWGEGVN